MPNIENVTIIKQKVSWRQVTEGIATILFAMSFAHAETAYFGYNQFPQSCFEFMCDMAALFIGFSGWRHLTNAKYTVTVNFPREKNDEHA